MEAGARTARSELAHSKNTLLAILALAQFMVILDAAIVNVALPSIGAGLDFAQDDLSWVVNAYLLAFGGFLLMGGRAADLVGRRRVFVVGALVFGVASLLAGLAQSPGWLIAARAAQGLAAAFLSSAALAIIVATFSEGSERNRALGVWGGIAGAGGAGGVLLGGVLTELAGWEWIFLINVPVAVVAATLALLYIPESHSEEAGQGFDLLGAVFVTVGLSALVYAIVEAADVGWGSAQTIILLLAVVVLLALFVGIEKRSTAPLVRLGLFRNRTVSGANVVVMTGMAAMFASMFFVSLYMQQVLGYTALKAGVSFLPLAIGFVVASGIASSLTGRIGFRPVLIFGLVVVAVGLYLFSRVSVDGTFVRNILPGSLVLALGGGFMLVGLIIAGTSGVVERESGLASGVINTSQQIGSALGIAILASVATSRTADVAAEAGDPRAIPFALTEGFQDAFLVGGGIALLGAVIAVGAIHAAESRRICIACQEDPAVRVECENRGVACSCGPAFSGSFSRPAFLRLIERPQPQPAAVGDDASPEAGRSTEA